MDELNEKASITDDPLKIEVNKGMQEYLYDYTLKSRNVHNFYMVLESNEKSYEDSLKMLYDLSKNVIESLKSGGMIARLMSEEEVKETVYNKLAPQTKETQPYEPGMDLTTWQPPDFVQKKYLQMDGMYQSS